MTFEPDDDFRAALTQIDLGVANLIVTPSLEAAQWAESHGYRIVRESQDGVGIYEIWGNSTPEHP